MAREYSIHPGVIAFHSSNLAAAKAALAGDQRFSRVTLTDQGPCTEYPNLTRYGIEVRGEHDNEKGREWFDAVAACIGHVVGATHRCRH